MERKVRSVYLASPFIKRDEAKAARERLQVMGIDVTARWIDTHVPNDNRSTDNELAQEAVEDLYDIDKADGFVILDLPGSSGGMFCELGYAIGRGKPVWIVSPEGLTMPCCLFYYLPNVTVVKTVWDVTLDPRVQTNTEVRV